MTLYKQTDRSGASAAAGAVEAAPYRKRLLFNPYFRALWMAMIASIISTWMSARGLAPASATPAQLLAAVHAVAGPQSYLLVLLSVTVSLHMARNGQHEFFFRPMGTNAFTVSILTFAGFVGPWVALCTAFILAFCAAMALLSVLPMLLDPALRLGMQTSLALGGAGPSWGRTAANLASGVMSALLGPVAICLLQALSMAGVFIATRRRSASSMPSRQSRDAPPTAAFPAC